MLRPRGAGGASAKPESYTTDPYGRIGGSFDTMRSMTQFFRREPKRQKTEDEQQVEREAQAEKAVQKELLHAKHVALIKEVGIGNSLSDKPKIVKAGPQSTTKARGRLIISGLPAPRLN